MYNTAQYQARLPQAGVANLQRCGDDVATDPERNFLGPHVCATGDDGCAGDVRLYDWEADGDGIVKDGAVHRAQRLDHLRPRVGDQGGPAKGPDRDHDGSVQAPRAPVLVRRADAREGGLRRADLDPQGQGQSDERGEAPDENEGSPAQTDGRPFFDGTEDALDFFLSTPKNVYKPRPSCDSGTSHAPKQNRRVAAGLNAPTTRSGSC